MKKKNTESVRITYIARNYDILKAEDSGWLETLIAPDVVRL